jgi:hypothetical protein
MLAIRRMVTIAMVAEAVTTVNVVHPDVAVAAQVPLAISHPWRDGLNMILPYHRDIFAF